VRKTFRFHFFINLITLCAILFCTPAFKVQAATDVSPKPGTIWTWGFNVFGQLGDGTTTTQWSPVSITKPTSLSSISGGYWHSLALKYDGTVWAWGKNANGQLGDATTLERDTPVQVSGLSDIIAISAGAYHNLALKQNGTVWSWGWNGGGQLGDGTTNDRSIPVMVANLTNVTAISAGYEHSLALKSDGTVWAWGYNFEGQLGNGNNADSSIPVQVTGLTDIKSISAGWFHSMAIKSDNTLWTWGMNSYGELGLNSVDNNPHPNPAQVDALTDVNKICGGSYHSLAIKPDGSMWVWGNNSQGQLGDNTTTSRPEPQTVPGLSNIVTMSGGWGHSLAVTDTGNVYAWGLNDQGQLGLGTTQTGAANKSSNLQKFTAGNNENTSQPDISDGNPRIADGSEWTWGQTPSEMMDQGVQTMGKQSLSIQSQSSIYQPNPTLISGLTNVSAVAGGYYHSLAIIPNPRPAWDVNGDHIVNIGDLILVGSHWNESGAPRWIPEDVNSDGMINVGDLVIIGQHWNESW
jgi:alpha-tubulin suppressor-like RCC1 family protein